MSKFQTLDNLDITNVSLQGFLSTEIDQYANGHEPGSPVHASLVEYVDRMVKLLPAITKASSTASAAYTLRRSLRALRRAQWLQLDSNAACVLDGLHAAPETVLFAIIYPDGKVITSATRHPVSNLGAYCRAIEAKTGAAVVLPWVPTAKDDMSLTTSRSWK